MRRRSQAPRGVAGKLRDHDEKTESLQRDVGRGSSALRDDGNNVIEMNGASPFPVLTPQGIDIAVGFGHDGTVKVTNEDGSQDRDMTVRDIGSSGNARLDGYVALNGTVYAKGSLSAGDNAVVASSGGLNAGPLAVAVKLQAGNGGITSSGAIGGYDLGMSHYINDALGNVRNGATYSSARWKHRLESFYELLGGRSAREVVTELTLVSWEWNPDTAPFMAGADPGRASGFTLEQLAEVAPGLVVDAPPDTRPRADDYIGPQTVEETLEAARPAPAETFRDDAIRTLLLAVAQEQEQELADLRARVGELEDRPRAASTSA